jgi:hypothetical protein
LLGAKVGNNRKADFSGYRCGFRELHGSALLDYEHDYEHDYDYEHEHKHEHENKHEHEEPRE